MEPIDIGTADRLIRYHNRLREGRGLVLAKNPDGRTLQVDVFGKGVTDCATERGVWGAVRVGDRVKVDTRTVPTVTGTYERLAANSLQRIGEDIAGGATTSATAWVPLCDVQDLHIGPDAFAIFTFGADIEVNAPQGSGQKQIYLMFNDEDVLGIDLGAGAGGYFAAFIIGPLPPWGSLRSVEGLNATWSSVATSTDVQTITRIRIEGRTQDEQNGQDVLRAGSLIVYG